MFNSTDKRRLYQLMDMYLSKTIGAETFSDEFYSCYHLGLDHNSMDYQEKKAFGELSEVTDRFTDSANDLKTYPGTYFDEVQLTEKVMETVAELCDGGKNLNNWDSVSK